MTSPNDYSLTPTNIDYMLNGYQSTLQDNSANAVRSSQDQLHYNQSVDGISAERPDSGKEVPQVSW